MARVNKVTLQVGEKTQDFEVSHAERILRMPLNGGWKLPEDSKYTLDEKHGLIKRTSTRAGKSSQE